MSDEFWTRESLESLVSEATKTANDPATPKAQADLLRRLRKVALSVLADTPNEPDDEAADFTTPEGEAYTRDGDSSSPTDL